MEKMNACKEESGTVITKTKQPNPPPIPKDGDSNLSMVVGIGGQLFEVTALEKCGCVICLKPLDKSLPFPDFKSCYELFDKKFRVHKAQPGKYLELKLMPRETPQRKKKK